MPHSQYVVSYGHGAWPYETVGTFAGSLLLFGAESLDMTCSSARKSPLRAEGVEGDTDSDTSIGSPVENLPQFTMFRDTLEIAFVPQVVRA